MKILLDTNVIIDLWDDSERSFESYKAADVAIVCGFELCIASAQAPTISYLLPARKYVSNAECVQAMADLFKELTILDVNEYDCKQALSHYTGDYEDNLLAWCAYRHNVDMVITQNIKDFKKSPIPAISPSEFVRMYKPANLIYEEVELGDYKENGAPLNE